MTLHAPVLSLLLTVSCCTINLPGDGTDGTGGTTAATGSTGEQPPFCGSPFCGSPFMATAPPWQAPAGMNADPQDCISPAPLVTTSSFNHRRRADRILYV